MDPTATYPAAYLQESRGAGIVAANVCCQLLSTLFVLGRVYSRAWLLRSWKADDHVLVIAWLLATASSITAYIQVQLGSGRHIVAVDPSNIPHLQLAGFVSQLLLIAVLPITKLSVCLSYRRVFYSDKRSRYTMNIVISLLFLTAIPLEFVSIFQCRPIHAFWTETTGHPQTCLDIRPAFYINGASNILTDIILIVVAFSQVLQLQMHKRQKYALLAVLSLGWLAVLAGILRMVRTAPVLNQRGDPLWESYEFNVWSAIEINVSLICAAAPCMKPVLSRWIPRLLGSSASRPSALTHRSTTLSSKIARPGGSQPMDHKSVSTTELTAVKAAGNSWAIVAEDLESLEGIGDSGRRHRSEDSDIHNTSNFISVSIAQY